MLPTTYKYEVYRGGSYLGVLPNVISEFTYSQDINTAGSQLVVTVGIDVDTSDQAISTLTDESGNVLTDELGNILTTSRAPDLYGNHNSQAMIRNGNRIVVWEYSIYHVNGIKVFDGVVKRWNPHIGDTDTVDITVLSLGTDLDNNIVYGSYPIDQVQSDTTQGNIGIENSPYVEVAQTFRAGPDVTELTGIVIQAHGANAFSDPSPTQTLRVRLFTYGVGNPDSGTLLDTVNITIAATSSSNAFGLDIYQVNFHSPIPTSPGNVYSVTFDSPTLPAGSIIEMAQNTSSAYVYGSLWHYASSTWSAITGSLYFITLTSNAPPRFTNSIYVSTSPTAMLTDFMTNYIGAGGVIQLGTITSTAVLATRSFILNTLLEGINDCLAIAPTGYLWYVDVGTSQLYFKPKSTTADHIFTFKVHINTLDLLATTENTKNRAYITAGQTVTGQAVLSYAADNTSAAEFGVGLDRISDSRINDAVTAQIVVQNYVETNAVEQYQTKITIFSNTFDISTIKLGDVVGFNGFGSFADSLLLQVVRVEKHPDFVTLDLGTVPLRASKRAESTQRQLLAIQTVNSPSSAA